MTIRERIWRIARGGSDPALAPLLVRGSQFPPSLTDPSATEFLATQEGVLRDSRERLDAGWKSDYEHNRTVAALLADAHAFLARYGDTRPARRIDEL